MSSDKEVNTEEIKKIQLDILLAFSKFCTQNHLTYFLAYGTLLGAIRHKGYIPWDDDIDVAMPRPDYNKFLKLFNKDTEQGYYVTDHTIDKKFPYEFAKLSDSRTRIVEFANSKYHLGINIDIFPIDGLPDDIKESNRHYNKAKFLRYCINAKKIKLSKTRETHKNLWLLLSKAALCLFSLSGLISKMEKILTQYKYEDSHYVANLNFGGPERRISKDMFQSVIPMEFENHWFPVPIGYDRWLKSIFGNYMTLPPVEKRITHHHFKVYRKE